MDGSLAALCLVGPHVVTTCAQVRHAGAWFAVARNHATACESCTVHVTVSSMHMPWLSALFTPAFVYCLTTWVQLVSFGTLVGLQVSTTQDFLTNTTYAELAGKTLGQSNLFARSQRSFARSQRGVQSGSVKFVNGPIVEITNS